MRTNHIRIMKPSGTRKLSNMVSVVLALAAITFGMTGSGRAQTETVLYNFGGYATDGGSPAGALIFDAAGNLYGTALGGGSSASGTVFELSRTGSAWNETLLYQFTGGSDGGGPSSGLIFDSAGNSYGTAYAGGSSGHGVVFELSPSGSGWSETVLYSFTGGADGGNPIAGLVFDPAGNLYGITNEGGNNTTGCTAGCGVVFKLSPGSGGSWTQSVLHAFVGSDGEYPIGGLALHAGALFGTTYRGGSFNIGVVFELKRGPGGWSYSVIHSFGDGYFPYSGVIFDAGGNLFGAASAGGTHGGGVVFEMKPAGGSWGYRVLHNFSGFNDGNFPSAPLVLDSAGNLYGTTYDGGVITECQDNGCGVVFKLTPGAGGSWADTVLHTFTGTPDGEFPEEAALILDSAGNVYGTTPSGGANGAGMVFEITP